MPREAPVTNATFPDRRAARETPRWRTGVVSSVLGRLTAFPAVGPSARPDLDGNIPMNLPPWGASPYFIEANGGSVSSDRSPSSRAGRASIRSSRIRKTARPIRPAARILRSRKSGAPVVPRSLSCSLSFLAECLRGQKVRQQLPLATIAVGGKGSLRILFHQPLQHESVEDRANRRGRFAGVAHDELPAPHSFLHDSLIDLSASRVEPLANRAKRLSPRGEAAKVDIGPEEGPVFRGRRKDQGDEGPHFLHRIRDRIDRLPHPLVNGVDEPPEQLPK